MILSPMPIGQRWPRLALATSMLLVMFPAFHTVPVADAQTVDETQLRDEVLTAMDAAGSYRSLRYDVLASNRQLDMVGEVSPRQGGRFVEVETGAIITVDRFDAGPLDDAALRFFAAAGEGWSYDGIDIDNGRPVSIFLETPTVVVANREARSSVLLIDETTHLPLRSSESGTDQAGPYAHETIYLDYGDPVRAIPATGTPVPGATPVAAGCGSRASSPTEIAEVFVAAATANSLTRAAPCFAPGRQPESWDDVFLGGQPDAPDDITGCRGRPYTVSESKIRSDFSAIVFNFDQACAVAGLDDWQRDLYDADTLKVTTVVVQTYQADNRWYVRDAFTLVPD